MRICSLKVAKIGELVDKLTNDKFTEIKNLNEIKMNFPIFDIIAKKEGEIYIFSAKARNKFGANGKLNDYYHIMYRNMSSKLSKAIKYLEEENYDTKKMHYCFLVCPIEENKEVKYYYGELEDIDNKNTVENIINNRIKMIKVKMTEDKLKEYKVFGSYSWKEVNNKINEKNDNKN